MAQFTRRDFLKTGAAASVLSATGGMALAKPAQRLATDWVTLGKSNVKVTRLAFGTGTTAGARNANWGRRDSRAWSATLTTTASASSKPPKAITACRRCWPSR